LRPARMERRAAPLPVAGSRFDYVTGPKQLISMRMSVGRLTAKVAEAVIREVTFPIAELSPALCALGETSTPSAVKGLPPVRID
jgi:hypothetical protein